MSNDFSKYTNEELQLIYKNQNCNQEELSSDCEAYNEEGRYTIYVEEYSEGCFITSAVCKTFGKPDDCRELMSFRAFRDTFMKKDDVLKNEVSNYYEIAPKICAAIDAKGEVAAKIEYEWIWNTYLSDAYDALNNNESKKAYEIYKSMVLKLQEIYLK